MLSVIICTYNRAKYIPKLLGSLAANTLDRSCFELIVVDNNCSDNTEDLCKAFADNNPDISFSYVHEAEQGLSAARNCGIRNAKGDMIVYVDDDAFVDSHYLENFVSFFRQHPEVMALGGPIEPHYETAEPPWMTKYTKALLTGWLNYGNSPREFPSGRYPGGGNAAYRAAVFEKVGMFNTELGRKGNLLLASEEKDIFDKMHGLGMKVMYIPDPVLYHCIPQYKLEEDYFNRLTVQIGKSERLRTKAIGNGKYIKRLLSEAIKWGGTLTLLCIYTVKFQPLKGWKLILFRRNVTKGLLSSH